MNHDRDPSASQAELAEARALAETLETGHGGAYPEDALATASLLRYSRDGGQLGPKRQEAILAELLAEHAAARRAPPGRARWKYFGWLGLPVAAALAIVIGLPMTQEPAPISLELPAPGAKLLRVQTQVLAGAMGAGEGQAERDDAASDDPAASDAQPAEQLAVLMQDYRGQMFSALRRGYGAR